jgi:tetratricopeptide (TPR) repeat protein
MKKIFSIRYLSVFLALALSVSFSKVLLAQTQSDYNQYMQLGYAATAQRNYSGAFNYFKQALQQRPGDTYASTALNNIQSYLKNRRQATLGFVSSIGRPDRRVPAASRAGSCVETGQTPMSVTPKTDPQLTTAAYPSFFVYVPQNSAQALEFVLEDNTSHQELYKTTLKPSKESGVVRVNFPDNANLPSLQNGKEYAWSFSVVCDTQSRDKDIEVKGSIQRIQTDPNLAIQLQKAQPRERAALYATSGIWQDTLTTVADLRRTNPNDLAVKTDWEDLLKSVGLEKIAKAPLLG